MYPTGTCLSRARFVLLLASLRGKDSWKSCLSSPYMVIRPIPHTDLKTSMFYVWLRLDGVCAVADRGPKRSSGVSCLRSDGVSLVRSGHSMQVPEGGYNGPPRTFRKLYRRQPQKQFLEMFLSLTQANAQHTMREWIFRWLGSVCR